MIRIPVSLFDIIKDDKGGFRIQVNNDRAAVVNYGLNRLADRLLEVAKSWTFKGLDEHWKIASKQYDKKSHLVKQFVFINDAPEEQHTGGLDTEALWKIMDTGREGWRQGKKEYTFATYPDSAEAKEAKAGRKSNRRGVKQFLIAKSRNSGLTTLTGRARLGDIYPTKPDFWLDRALNKGLETFIQQLEASDFGEVDADYVSFGDMPGVDLVPNLYELASGRGDLDVTAGESDDFLYGDYGGSHRQNVSYGGDDPTEPWYASFY